MVENQAADPKQREKVDLDDIFKIEKIRFGSKLTTTRVGYYLAIFVLIYLFMVTIVLFLDYFLHVPSKPTATTFSTEELQNYTTLSNLVLERILKLFEQLVEKSMLPVLTAILGYIFGVRGVEREER